MNKEELGLIIKNIICDKTGVYLEDVSDDADFFDDLGFDSLDKVEILMQIEKEFNLSIKDEEVEELSTAAELIEFISNIMK
jgi:acyl carrier protein